MSTLTSAEIAILSRVAELARRYGLRPSQAEATLNFKMDEDGDTGHYTLKVEFGASDPETYRKCQALQSALKCDENCKTVTEFLSQMEDIVDRAISLAPRSRAI